MGKKRIFLGAVSALLILFIAGVSMFATRNFADTPDRLLTLGEKYLAELNYEQALVQFLKVIEIDPMNPRGYIGAAEAYVGLGRMEDAVAVLQNGLDMVNSQDIQAMLDGLLNVQRPIGSVEEDYLTSYADEYANRESVRKPLEGYPKTERNTSGWNIHDEGSYSITEYNEFGDPVTHHAYTSSDVLDCIGTYTYDESGNLLEARWEYLRANELRSRPSVDVTTFDGGKPASITTDYFNDGVIDSFCENEYIDSYEKGEQPYQWTTYYYNSSGELEYYVVEKYDYSTETYNPDGTIRD